MFCDLVGSTDLSGKLDPEDLREVVRAYQETAAEIIYRYEGHIAQYLGDGLLIYFGFPVAHENDTHRAVYTGLGIVDGMTTLNTRLKADYGVQLAVRIGIHTGPVVVGEMGAGGRHENLALGETPNIAARLEGLAQPNTAVISPVTAQLVQRSFILEELGSHRLKGVTEPMRLYSVVAPRTSDQADDSVTGGFDALLGRDEEIGLLLRRWEQSKDGLGQVVLISGEAGIGKSSLVEGLRRHVRQEGLTRITYRCSPYHTSSALYPIIEHVQRALGWQPEDTADTQLAKLEQALGDTSLPLEEAVTLMASLLSLPLPENRYPTLSLSPEQQRQQTHDTLVAWLLEEVERQPVLAVWEDLHWADPSTLEALGLMVEQAPTTAMLHVLTFRPEFEPPWPTRSHMTPLTLNRLERPQVEAMITGLARSKALPSEVVEHIVDKTDGVPLYVEELTKMLLASDLLREDAGAYVLTGPLLNVAIPDTLQDSLMARLDQLHSAKEIAQLGSVLGREFSYDMIAAIAPPDQDLLRTGLAQLVDAELLYQRGRPPQARYVFKHALIQDAAYASLLRGTQQQAHQQIVHVLAEQYHNIVEAQPELLAQHAFHGGLWDKAVAYFRQAGIKTLNHSAYREAVTCFEQALNALQHLPEDQALREQAIDLRLDLRSALVPLGAQERMLDVLREAERLAEFLQDRRRLGLISGFLAQHCNSMGDYDNAIASSQHALDLATTLDDLGLQIGAQLHLGAAYQALGEYRQAIEFLSKNMASLSDDLLYEHFGRHFLPAVSSRTFLSLCLVAIGEFTEGMGYAEEGLRIAEASGQPSSIVFACYGVGFTSLYRGELQRAIAAFERGWELCQVSNVLVFFLPTVSSLSYAYALSRRMSEAQSLLQQVAERDFPPNIFGVLWAALLSEAYLLVSCTEDARKLAIYSLDIARSRREWGHQAWSLRLFGDFAMHGDPPDIDAAKTYYQEALALAHDLGMRPLQAHCHRAMGALYRQERQSERACAELSIALEMYRDMEMMFWLLETEAALAHVE